MSGIYSNVDKIVAIGDLHGDILQLISILLDAKLIKKKNTNKCINSNDYDIRNWIWIGEDTYVVQLGDIFDGGGRSEIDIFDENEVEIYKFLINLKLMAKKKSGNVLLIMGNHEIMNFNNNYKYVQNKTLHKCLIIQDNDFSYKLNNKKTCDNNDRNKLFSIPNGPLAKSMDKFVRGAIKIDDNVFCHGGISKIISDNYSIRNINNILKSFLKGNINNNNPDFKNIYGSEGIIWYRDYIKNSNCSDLSKTLKNLKCKRMIVGHTPQKDGITNYCRKFNESLWAIDVGLSRAFNTKSKCQYLVIQNDNKNKKNNKIKKNSLIIKECDLLNEC